MVSGNPEVLIGAERLHRQHGCGTKDLGLVGKPCKIFNQGLGCVQNDIFKTYQKKKKSNKQ